MGRLARGATQPNVVAETKDAALRDIDRRAEVVEGDLARDLTCDGNDARLHLDRGRGDDDG